MDERAITVNLELRLEGESLSGSAEENGQRTHFLGWLGLLGAIDRLVYAARLRGGPDNSAPGPVAGLGADLTRRTK
jgi:hypothetical protein